jgi:MFS family permease
MVSDIGTWVQLIVVGSLIAADTGSAVQTGLVALATFAPQGLAAPIGGLLADRFDRRRVFATGLMMQALFTTGLAVALGLGVRAPLVLTAFILLASAAGATGAPSYSAMQPDLVPAEELMAMVSLGVYSWNGGRIVGPVLGSLLALWAGPAWTVAFNAATFLVLATAVSLLRRPFKPHGEQLDESMRNRLVGGWRALRATPGCVLAVGLLVLFSLTTVPFMGLIPIYVKAEFAGGTGLAGAVAAAQGIGAIVGGMLITWLGAGHARSWLLGRLMPTLGVLLALYALAPTPALVVAAAAVLGGGCAAMFITVAAIVQRDAPQASRGRVMSIWQSSMGVSYGLGLLFIGSIGDALSLRTAFVTGGVLLIAVGWLLALRLPQWRAAADGVPAGAADADLPLCPAPAG